VSFAQDLATTPAATVSPAAAANDFSRGAARLDEALYRLHDPDPKGVLVRVRRANAAYGRDVCPFEWNHGNPSLAFISKNGVVELQSVMTLCAEGVEDLRLSAGTRALSAARP